MTTRTLLPVSEQKDNIIIDTVSESFSVDPAILYSLIYQQAGTVEKAIMELVMNEVDAKANEVHIDIESDMKTIRVYGDGYGFKSSDEIMKLFKVFGFDHTTDEEMSRDRSFGRYGLGRGQIFAHGKSTWKTNQFEMVVDLKNKKQSECKDLPFDLNTYKETLYNGCHIEIELYKEMNIFARNQLLRTLQEKLRYVQAPLFVNGKIVNSPMDSVKWTVKKGDLAFKAAKGGAESGLSFYNQGVFIMHVSHHRLGVSGDITSVGNAFDVNMARNDIQVATCKLWPLVKDLVKEHAEKRRATRLTVSDRKYILSLFFGNNIEDIQKNATKKVVLLASGKYVSLDELSKHANGVITADPDGRNNLGERVHNQNAAAVICSSMLEDAGVSTIEEWIDALYVGLGLKRDAYYVGPILKFPLVAASFKELSEGLSDSYEYVDPKDLTELDKCRMKAMSYLNTKASKLVGPYEGNYDATPRKLLMGKSETARGWTNGRNMVALEQTVVRSAFNSGIDSLVRVFNILIHEYCHQQSSEGDHAHGNEFNERYREALEEGLYSPYKVCFEAMRRYLSERKRLGIEQNTNEICQLIGNEELVKKSAY